MGELPMQFQGDFFLSNELTQDNTVNLLNVYTYFSIYKNMMSYSNFSFALDFFNEFSFSNMGITESTTSATMIFLQVILQSSQQDILDLNCSPPLYSNEWGGSSWCND